MIKELKELSESLKSLGLEKHAKSLDAALLKYSQEGEFQYDPGLDPELDPDIQEIRREREEYRRMPTPVTPRRPRERRPPIAHQPQARTLVEGLDPVLKDLKTYLGIALDYMQPYIEAGQKVNLMREEDLLSYAGYVANQILQFVDPESKTRLRPEMLQELAEVYIKKNKETFEKWPSNIVRNLVRMLVGIYQKLYRDSEVALAPTEKYLHERSELLSEFPEWKLEEPEGKRELLIEEKRLREKHREDVPSLVGEEPFRWNR